MSPAACVAALVAWAPQGDAAARERVCAAVLAATAERHERALLLVTAAEESLLLPRVLDCRKRGDRGRALGAWQVHPRSRREARALCTVESAAAIALQRLRESMALCARQRAEHRLAAYATGKCRSAVGKRISARRWGRALAMGGNDES